MSEVSMYSAAGTFQRLFNYLRLNQVVLDFDLKKKKKRALLFQSNQTKETVRIYVGLEP